MVFKGLYRTDRWSLRNYKSPIDGLRTIKLEEKVHEQKCNKKFAIEAKMVFKGLYRTDRWSLRNYKSPIDGLRTIKLEEKVHEQKCNKKFAIEARKKLIDSVTDKAGMLGITETLCSAPITKGADFEVYKTIAGTEVTLNRRQCEQRRRRYLRLSLVDLKQYRVRVLSTEKEGKMEQKYVGKSRNRNSGRRF